MAGRIARGDIWLYEFQPTDKRRPVVVISRDEAIAVLNAVLVAPVTSTRRGSPGEVTLGIGDGLKQDCAANLDAVQTVGKDRLRRHIGHLSEAKMREICRALAIATGCDG